MRSVYDQDDILFEKITASALKTEISGNVYRSRRPSGSLLEDIVINTLNLSDGDIQRGTSNVNIYVKDIEAVNGFSQPNSLRLKALTEIALEMLRVVYGGYYMFEVKLVSMIEEVGTGFTYSNIRIDFKFYESQS